MVGSEQIGLGAKAESSCATRLCEKQARARGRTAARMGGGAGGRGRQHRAHCSSGSAAHTTHSTPAPLRPSRPRPRRRAEEEAACAAFQPVHARQRQQGHDCHLDQPLRHAPGHAPLKVLPAVVAHHWQLGGCQQCRHPSVDQHPGLEEEQREGRPEDAAL